jgi:hypothetical protein
MKRLRHPLVITTLIACGLMLLAGAVAPRWTERAIAAHLRQRIDTVDEPAAAMLVEQLALTGDSGLRHLVELLNDPRAGVRRPVRDALGGKVEVWSQSPAEHERSVALLARLLVSHETREVHSRMFVKNLTLRLVRWPLESTPGDHVQFLAECSEIMKRTADAWSDEPEIARQPRPSAPSAHVAGEDAPYEEPLSQPIAELEPEVIIADDAPGLFPSGDEQPLPPNRIQLDTPRRIRSTEIDLQGYMVDEGALRKLSDRALMRHLHGIPALAEAAERELRRRGFNDATLRLARALDDPDPRVRRELGQSLPGMSGVDPAPWLWELAEDEDAEVRRIVRSTLAASSNPQTRAKVGRLK